LGGTWAFLATFYDGSIDAGAIYRPTRRLTLKLRVRVDFLVEAFEGEPRRDRAWSQIAEWRRQTTKCARRAGARS